MIKYIVSSMILICELYGCVILASIFTIRQETWVLVSLICACILVCASAFLFTYILRDKKEKKVDNSKYCPYFIEKYDDINNPEYIDREIK